MLVLRQVSYSEQCEEEKPNRQKLWYRVKYVMKTWDLPPIMILEGKNENFSKGRMNTVWLCIFIY